MQSVLKNKNKMIKEKMTKKKKQNEQFLHFLKSCSMYKVRTQECISFILVHKKNSNISLPLYSHFKLCLCNNIVIIWAAYIYVYADTYNI